jgi:hypothetical protein
MMVASSPFIIFLDDDTSTANSNIDFEIINDPGRIFQHTCVPISNSRSTVFHCSKLEIFKISLIIDFSHEFFISLNKDLKFMKDGHFTTSPYCVILQAKENIRNKIHKENATICVYTSQPMLTPHGIELLPTPAEYRGERSGSKKIKKLKNSDGENSEFSSTSSNVIIEFPEFVKIHQNASFLARVTEPLKSINDKSIS